jgi:uncharacterized repeat protein (TIGR02543 family)
LRRLLFILRNKRFINKEENSMKLRRIIALVVIATLITIFATTVFAATGASFGYPSGNGEANQVFVSSANADEGLIEPNSVDGNLGEGDTWKFTARPIAGYEFDRWDVSGADNVSGLDKSSPVLSFSYKEGSLTADEANKFSAVAVFKAAAADPETTESAEASEEPETSVSPEASTVPETSVSPEASTVPETSVSPETSVTPQPSTEPSIAPQSVMGMDALGAQAAQNYTLTIQKIGSSSSTNGSTVNPANGTSFPAGTVVDLSATPNSSSKLVGFFSTLVNTSYGNTYRGLIDKVTMDGNKTVYALFSSNNYTFDHIDVELDGTITIDRQINGVSQPGYPKTLNITVSHPSATIVAGGSTINLPENKFNVQGAEFRALNQSYTWPSSVTVNATLKDQNGNTYPFHHEFTQGEIKAAYAFCPGTEPNRSKGFDYVLDAKDIENEIVHTVVFKTSTGGKIGDGSTNTITHTGVPDGTDISTIAPATIPDPGYRFTGWSPSLPSTVTDDGTYTAQFEPVSTFKVKNMNGPGNSGSGMGGDHGYIHATYNGSSVDLDAGEEHTFVYVASAGNVQVDFVPDSGWSFLYYVIDNGAQHINRDPDNIDPNTYVGQSGSNDTIKLNPKWTTGLYTVTYDANGATGGNVPVDSSTYGNDDTVTVIGNTGILVRMGYTFGGWTMSQDGSGTVYNANDTFTMGSANVTLFAKWNADNYTITFDLAGKGTTSNQTVFDNKHYGDTFPTAPTVTANSGWTFTGWSPSPLPTTVTKSATYTAQYTQNNYTITFDLAGKGITSNQTVFENKHYGDAFPTSPTVIANSGWTFTGWSPSPLPTKVTGSATYTAQYTPNYTITFDLAGKGTTSNQTVFNNLHSGDPFPTEPTVTANNGWTFGNSFGHLYCAIYAEQLYDNV